VADCTVAINVVNQNLCKGMLANVVSARKVTLHAGRKEGLWNVLGSASVPTIDNVQVAVVADEHLHGH
jgi:hypothetical protein